LKIEKEELRSRRCDPFSIFNFQFSIFNFQFQTFQTP